MKYFETFCTERNIKKQTIQGYRTAINRYTEYYGLTLDELIDEAIDEETDKIDKRRRSIKGRLLQFRTYLFNETDLKTSSITKIINNIISIYHHFDIEIPTLPVIQSDDVIETTYFDLPTKKQIGMAVEIAGVRLASLILFIASSGTGRTECSNMTIRDFIEGCRDYITTESDDLKDILEDLYGSIEPIVPTLYIYRQKTKKKYYTFCTPEASHKIIEWLLLRIEIAENEETTLSYDDTIWDWTIRQITYQFNQINDELNFGFKGSYRFFRPHSLRKFNASNIGLEADSIDLLQGRSRDIIHETYIKTNPAQFREKYMMVMENVTIGNINKEIKHEEFTININLNFYGYDYNVTL